LVQVNDMSKHGKASSDSADRRRRLQADDGDDEDGLRMTVKKCLWLGGVVGEVCVSREMEGSVEVEYGDVGDVDDVMVKGTVDTEEWRVEGMSVGAAQIYECHDHFEFMESVCVEKWKLDEGEVVVVAKHETAGDMEFALDAEDVWAKVFHFADEKAGTRGRRMCREVLERTLCVDVADDEDSGRVRKIERIYIEQFVPEGEEHA